MRRSPVSRTGLLPSKPRRCRPTGNPAPVTKSFPLRRFRSASSRPPTPHPQQPCGIPKSPLTDSNRRHRLPRGVVDFPRGRRDNRATAWKLRLSSVSTARAIPQRRGDSAIRCQRHHSRLRGWPNAAQPHALRALHSRLDRLEKTDSRRRPRFARRARGDWIRFEAGIRASEALCRTAPPTSP